MGGLTPAYASPRAVLPRCFARSRRVARRILGGDHPDTLITRSNCAAAYLKMGSIEKGLLLLERALNDCERVLGSTHPLTKSIRVILSRMS
ncbi:tetratricopeptide repeat protein [Nonomuraea sp. NPDC047897]|uniref:tetratricopeptide repeat protein n=1 Tax=Nonomuraea sp. NPDC047897 TaxID=3364346 RepID=UPI00371A2751